MADLPMVRKIKFVIYGHIKELSLFVPRFNFDVLLKSETSDFQMTKWTQFRKTGPILEGPVLHLMGPVPSYSIR